MLFIVLYNIYVLTTYVSIWKKLTYTYKEKIILFHFKITQLFIMGHVWLLGAAQLCKWDQLDSATLNPALHCVLGSICLLFVVFIENPTLWRSTIIERNAVWPNIVTVNYLQLAVHSMSDRCQVSPHLPWKFQKSQPPPRVHRVALRHLGTKIGITDLRTFNVLAHLIFKTALWFTVFVTIPRFGDKGIDRLEIIPKVK